MNANNEIGIETILMDEIVDNYVFKYELIDCIKKNNLRNWGIIDAETRKKNNQNLKNGDEILESEYITSIGNITIYTDVKKGDILVSKTDKIKDRSSVTADKRKMQNQQ